MATPTEKERKLYSPWLITIGLVLLCLELILSLRLDVQEKHKVYWLLMLEQATPLLHFYLALLISLSVVIWVGLSRKVRHTIRVALIVLFLLPLPIAFLGSALRVASQEHVSSQSFQGHVYRLSYLELSGDYYTLYACDRVGFLCHEMDYFPAFGVDPRQVALTGNSGAENLMVVTGTVILREYSISSDSQP